MPEIPNDKYITVKRDNKNKIKIYVGNKPATKYHGQEIYGEEYVKEVFEWMQEQNPDLEEFRIGAFDTPGEYAKVGNPSGEYGPNAWCGVKLRSGGAAWVFRNTYGSAVFCAYDCAASCAHTVHSYAGFRAAVFDSAIDKTEQFELVKVIRGGDIKITIEKLKSNGK